MPLLFRQVSRADTFGTSSNPKAMLLQAAQRSASKEAEDMDALDSTLFEAEEEQNAVATAGQDDLVKLNVGGVYFESSVKTLTRVPDSMLGLMFGRCDIMLQTDSDGSIFIDRSGDRFGLILDFIRDGEDSNVALKIRGLPEAQREMMMQELDYFGLEAAVFPPPWFEGAAFSRGAKMNTARAGCATVQIGRRVFVFGGYGTDYAPSASLEIFDLATTAFTLGPSMLSPRLRCAAIAINAHRVLVLADTTAEI
jgi:hypothetical protein